jgi:HD-like signal output (HDOD) protein
MKIDEYAAQAGELFVLPDSVTQLKKRMDDEAASMDDVSEIVATDPALASQLLKVANSAMYRFPRKIDTITRALQVIGTRSAYDLALAYGVSHAFKDVSGSVLDLDKFWEQSVSCGLLSKHFADFHKHRESERFFVAGLLHNIGELVVLSLTPDKAENCLHFSKDITPANLQLGVLGFKYTDLSAALIRQWGLPESIWQPMNEIHQSGTDSRDGHIVRLAYHLALDNVNSEIYPAYTNITDEMHQRLDLEMEDLEDALDMTNLQCISLMSLFSPTAFMLY